VLRDVEKIVRNQHRLLPEAPRARDDNPDDHAAGLEGLPRLIERAIEYGKNSLMSGEPGLLAGARYHSLASQVAGRYPEQAADLGIFIPPAKPHPVLWCLFPSGPSLVFCLLVALIAISNHNPPGYDDDDGSTG